MLKRSLHQSPDHFVPSAKAVYKQGEIYTQTNRQAGRQAGRQTHIALLEITQSYTELSFIYVTCIEFCNYKAFYEVTSSIHKSLYTVTDVQQLQKRRCEMKRIGKDSRRPGDGGKKNRRRWIYFSTFICNCNIALHVSHAFCFHLQEHLDL